MKKDVVNIAVKEGNVFIVSRKNITEDSNFSDVVDNKYAQSGYDAQRESYFVIIPLKPTLAFMLRHSLKPYDVNIRDDYATMLKEAADKVPSAQVKMSPNEKRLDIIAPMVPFYRSALSSVDAYPNSQGKYTLPVSRAVELYTSMMMSNSKYPPFHFSQKVLDIFQKPLSGFDGDIESLRSIPLDALHVISSDVQSWKQRKKSQKSLQEKFSDQGINSLYDLLFNLPRRYVDRSSPQKIHELVVGEEATIIGVISSVETFNQNRGLNIDVEIPGRKGKDSTDTVRVSFFTGAWMQNKYKEGAEVVVTGKYKPWRNMKQITGSTIEFVDSASAFPVTPIYQQSEKNGVTTVIIMRAIQELLSRMGNVELPEYLQSFVPKLDDDQSKEVRDVSTYSDLIKRVHFPEELATKDESIKKLAFYELVEMQIIIQSRKNNGSREAAQGVAHKKYRDKGYASAIKNLPFELTGSQEKSVAKIISGLESKESWQGLLSGDVGSGKTQCAILSSLVVTDSGSQVVVVAPTEILAQQMFESFMKTKNSLDSPWRDTLKIGFFTGKMKAAEKREVLGKVASGEYNILVSTQAVLSDNMVFNDLGFVVIDEQQKFGAHQRSVLLNARQDGKTPDVLMMTATPIPRSTAQVFYGDMDFIALKDKPAGRLPIDTKWIKESPVSVASTAIHPMWEDVKEEILRGNKAFVVAPLVAESSAIDAASVEETYKSLRGGAFNGISVDFIHGKMKAEEARQKMLDFKNGVFSLLISSTVIEVGVDISDATRMVVLSADRLGSSTLHQIRGRVGRNSLPSRCYLVASDVSDNGAHRLQTLVDSQDGFEIAKSDLALRSEGTLFSSQQSGRSEFRFLTLARHGRWVMRAVECAQGIMASPVRDKAVAACRSKYGASVERIL